MLRLSRDARGVSEVIGAVALIGITLVTVSGMMIVASPAIDLHTDEARYNMMQDSISGFDASIHSVATADSPRRSHSFDYSGEGAGQVVSLIESGPRVTVAVDGTMVYNETVGRAHYQPGASDQSISYEAGGIFRAYSETSVGVEKEPTFTFTDRPGESPTATIPIYDLEGHSVLHENVLVTRTGHTNLYPSKYGNSVTVTVYSEYAGAWADYFNRTAPESATVTYSAPPGDTPRTSISLSSGSGVYLHLHEYEIEIKP